MPEASRILGLLYIGHPNYHSLLRQIEFHAIRSFASFFKNNGNHLLLFDNVESRMFNIKYHSSLPVATARKHKFTCHCLTRKLTLSLRSNIFSTLLHFSDIRASCRLSYDSLLFIGITVRPLMVQALEAKQNRMRFVFTNTCQVHLALPDPSASRFTQTPPIEVKPINILFH